MKRKMKRFLSMAIAIVLTLAALPAMSAAAADFDGHWAQSQIARLVEKGVVTPDASGNVNPNGNVTRAQLARMIVDAFGLEAEGESAFSDVAETDWFAKYVTIAVGEELMSGYPDGTFRPNNPISRQEAAVVFARYQKLEDNAAAAAGFTDAGAIKDYAKGAVGAVVEAKLMSGFPNGSFGPAANMTRAQAFTIIDIMMGGPGEAPAEAPVVKADENAVSVGANETFGNDNEVTQVDNLVVTGSGATVKNVIVTGDLTIASSVGEGEVQLLGVEVQGDTVIRGGGPNSVIMKDTPQKEGKYNNVIVYKVNVTVRLENGEIETITYEATGRLVVGEDGTVSLVEVFTTGEVRLTGTIEEVSVEVAGAKVTLSDAEVALLNVASGATDSTITIPTDSTIDKLIADAMMRAVGLGKITEMVANVYGTIVQTLPDNISGTGSVIRDENAGAYGSSTGTVGNTDPDDDVGFKIVKFELIDDDTAHVTFNRDVATTTTAALFKVNTTANDMTGVSPAITNQSPSSATRKGGTGGDVRVYVLEFADKTFSSADDSNADKIRNGGVVKLTVSDGVYSLNNVYKLTANTNAIWTKALTSEKGLTSVKYEASAANVSDANSGGTAATDGYAYFVSDSSKTSVYVYAAGDADVNGKRVDKKYNQLSYSATGRTGFTNFGTPASSASATTPGIPFPQNGLIDITIRETAQDASIAERSFTVVNTGMNDGIILAPGSLGQPGENKSSIVGLQSGKKYVVSVTNGSGEAIKYVTAAGALSGNHYDIANLSGTSIVGLTAGTAVYKVWEASNNTSIAFKPATSNNDSYILSSTAVTVKTATAAGATDRQATTILTDIGAVSEGAVVKILESGKTFATLQEFTNESGLTSSQVVAPSKNAATGLDLRQSGKAYSLYVMAEDGTIKEYPIVRTLVSNKSIYTSADATDGNRGILKGIDLLAAKIPAPASTPESLGAATGIELVIPSGWAAASTGGSPAKANAQIKTAVSQATPAPAATDIDIEVYKFAAVNGAPKSSFVMHEFITVSEYDYLTGGSDAVTDKDTIVVVVTAEDGTKAFYKWVVRTVTGPATMDTASVAAITSGFVTDPTLVGKTKLTLEKNAADNRVFISTNAMAAIPPEWDTTKTNGVAATTFPMAGFTEITSLLIEDADSHDYNYAFPQEGYYVFAETDEDGNLVGAAITAEVVNGTNVAHILTITNNTTSTLFKSYALTANSGATLDNAVFNKDFLPGTSYYYLESASFKGYVTLFTAVAGGTGDDAPTTGSKAAKAYNYGVSNVNKTASVVFGNADVIPASVYNWSSGTGDYQITSDGEALVPPSATKSVAIINGKTLMVNGEEYAIPAAGTILNMLNALKVNDKFTIGTGGKISKILKDANSAASAFEIADNGDLESNNLAEVNGGKGLELTIPASVGTIDSVTGGKLTINTANATTPSNITIADDVNADVTINATGSGTSKVTLGNLFSTVNGVKMLKKGATVTIAADGVLTVDAQNIQIVEPSSAVGKTFTMLNSKTVELGYDTNGVTFATANAKFKVVSTTSFEVSKTSDSSPLVTVTKPVAAMTFTLMDADVGLKFDEAKDTIFKGEGLTVTYNGEEDFTFANANATLTLDDGSDVTLSGPNDKTATLIATANPAAVTLDSDLKGVVIDATTTKAITLDLGENELEDGVDVDTTGLNAVKHTIISAKDVAVNIEAFTTAGNAGTGDAIILKTPDGISGDVKFIITVPPTGATGATQYEKASGFGTANGNIIDESSTPATFSVSPYAASDLEVIDFLTTGFTLQIKPNKTITLLFAAAGSN